MSFPRAFVLAVLVFGLFLFTSTQAAPQPGQVFGKWRVACLKKAKGPQVCHVFQTFTQKDGKQLLHTAVGYAAGQKDPVAIFTVPLGVWLPNDAEFWVDGVKIADVAYESCHAQGCRAGLILTDEVMFAMKRAKAAELLIHLEPGRKLRISIALNGLNAGLFALRS